MRVTLSMLEAKVKQINEAIGAETSPFTSVDGGTKTNVGTFYISQAYGGVALFRIVGTSGSITMPIRSGHVTKRELNHQLDGMLYALNLA
jgi:hypothetical protein